jgi:putative copper resistance protein D
MTSARTLAARARSPSKTRWVLLAAAALVLALGAAVAVSLAAGTWPYTALGRGDPGALVRIGAPVLRLTADAAATVCIGSLVFATCFAGKEPSGALSPHGYAALRSASRWAGLWFAAALVLVPFNTAKVTGEPLGGGQTVVTSPTAGDQLRLLTSLEQPIAWLLTMALALLVAACARLVLRWRPAVALLVLAVLAVLPPLATAHAASDTGHDLATAAILIHVPAAVIWVGVLVALCRPSWRRAGTSAARTRRYARLAAGAWVVLAGSGLVTAAVLVPGGEVVSTQYGHLLLATIALTAALGVLGVAWRHRALRGIRTARLAAGELALLAATLGASVGLTQLAPPSFVGHGVTADQTLLGYDLTGAPSLARLAFDWRLDVFFAALAAVLAAAYLLGVRRLRRRGEPWPPGRTVAWLAGCAVLLVATSSGIGRYAAAMFSLHMASHMAVAMLVPLCLVLGAPLTLLGRTLPEEGPRAWLEDLRASPAARALTHPIVALVLFAGAPFALYFTGLFDLAVRYHWAMLLSMAVFLVIGYFFAWTAIGVDALPRTVPNLARLGMLLAAMPFDIVFGALVIGSTRVIGDGAGSANMYSALDLPWVANLLADQRIGGGIALAIGEGSLLLAMAALLLRWSRLEPLGLDVTPELRAPTRAASCSTPPAATMQPSPRPR